MDYCLLEDIEEVKPYVNLDRLRQLNAFETILLVFTLVQKKEMEKEARSIVKKMRMEEDSVKKNYQQFKQSFDTVINAKAEVEQPRGGGARTKQTARKSTSAAAPRMNLQSEEIMID